MPLIQEMLDRITTIVVETLCLLAIVAGENKLNRASKCRACCTNMSQLTEIPERIATGVMGLPQGRRTDIKDTLNTLTKLMQELAQMATAQVPETRTVDNNVADMVLGVDNRVLNVDHRVAGVDNAIASVDDDVKSIDDKGAAITVIPIHLTRIFGR